jgi:predicted nucleic acid-binding protein
MLVTDTSTLRHLVRVGAEFILEKLHGTVLMPNAVRDELRQGHVPERVRAWADKPPSSFKIEDPKFIPLDLAARTDLHNGEKVAMALAEERGLRISIDEGLGFKVASEERGLKTTRLVEMVEEAAKRGFCDFDKTMAAVRAPEDPLTGRGGFRVKDKVVEEAAERVRAFRQEHKVLGVTDRPSEARESDAWPRLKEREVDGHKLQMLCRSPAEAKVFGEAEVSQDLFKARRTAGEPQQVGVRLTAAGKPMLCEAVKEDIDEARRLQVDLSVKNKPKM